LLAFLVILLLNRTLPSSTTTSTYPSSPLPPSAYPPGAYPSSPLPPSAYPPSTYSPDAYPPGTYSPGAYPPGTYPTPYAAQPSSPANPTIPPNSSDSGSFKVDSALNGFSGFIKSAFDRIDEFVYGNPYAVDQPTRSLQPDTAVSQQPDALPAEQPTEPPAPGYQIRPDGVPSRVSSPVNSSAPVTSAPATRAPVTRPATSTSSSRPVSAWW
jgi:hypothetical protein